MKFKFSVERTHINRGYKSLSDSCPIALCIQESIDVNKVNVGCTEEDHVYFTMNEGTEYKALLPIIACEFIEQFDDSKRDSDDLEPFEFEIDAEVIGPQPLD